MVNGADAEIVNNVGANQFELRDGNHVSVLTYRKLGDTIVYRHTVVPPALRGRGIAERLAEHALNYARENGLDVVPMCPYVLAYLARHPEYADIVVPRARWTEVLDAS